jgi:enoyl-CoA hydratase/carnithine racemase
MIKVTDDGPVRILTLDRPDRLNAFTAQSYRLLAQHLTAAAADDNVVVTLLAGNGRGFCAGADVKALMDEATDTADMGVAFDTVLDALMTFPKPLVAAVHGSAVGFGFTMLLHCDVVLVSESARLRAPFTLLQTAPEAGSSWLLPRAIGPQRAAELLLTSRWLTAAEAVEFGVAARVCDDATLRDDGLALAHSIAEHGAAATQVTKRLLRDGSVERIRAAIGRELDGAGELNARRAPEWGRRG